MLVSRATRGSGAAGAAEGVCASAGEARNSRKRASNSLFSIVSPFPARGERLGHASSPEQNRADNEPAQPGQERHELTGEAQPSAHVTHCRIVDEGGDGDEQAERANDKPGILHWLWLAIGQDALPVAISQI